jgi:hypothetical protein
MAFEFADHIGGIEIVAYQPEGAVGIKMLAVITDNARRFLPAVLKCV